MCPSSFLEISVLKPGVDDQEELRGKKTNKHRYLDFYEWKITKTSNSKDFLKN